MAATNHQSVLSQQVCASFANYRDRFQMPCKNHSQFAISKVTLNMGKPILTIGAKRDFCYRVHNTIHTTVKNKAQTSTKKLHLNEQLLQLSRSKAVQLTATESYHWSIIYPVNKPTWHTVFRTAWSLKLAFPTCNWTNTVTGVLRTLSNKYHT